MYFIKYRIIDMNDIYNLIDYSMSCINQFDFDLIIINLQIQK
jgi:hypothetical protein